MIGAWGRPRRVWSGYSNGTILMVRMNDGAEILVRKNGGEQVSALAWNAKGTMLAFAAEGRRRAAGVLGKIYALPKIFVFGSENNLQALSELRPSG